MWFIYTILFIGAIASMINLVFLVCIATFLVRQYESPVMPTGSKPETGLTDISTSQMPYARNSEPTF